MNADEFLRTIILELKDIEEEALVPELRIEDLELDSLDYVEIQVGVKKTFNVSIDPVLFSSGEIKTLSDMTRYIERNRNTGTATVAG